MSKRNKIIYWIATLWLSLGMASTGLVQIMQMKEETAAMLDLGYPAYFLVLLGIWKLLGVIAILLPRLPVLKEWAYAGFFFSMSGALYSHIAMGSPANEVFPSVLLLALTILSWYFRPANRKVNTLAEVQS
ncbi:MAG: DoxX family protein [Sphingobacteriales bacterium]|nr:MAG: DoxX family protein [Sphingobacteriales bacterium]